MSEKGSIAEWQEFSGKEAKLPCRFRVSALVLLMTGDGWMAEGLLRDPQSVYSRQAFDHWAAIYGTSSALRDEFREGGLYPHKVRQLGSDISQMLLGKGLNRLASGSVLWSQV